MLQACAEALGCRSTPSSRSSRRPRRSTRCSRRTSATPRSTLTEENIQSRIRGVTLMALSNKFGPMLLTTGNKSEMSVGYATIYGDMAGGYSTRSRTPTR